MDRSAEVTEWMRKGAPRGVPWILPSRDIRDLGRGRSSIALLDGEEAAAGKAGTQQVG